MTQSATACTSVSCFMAGRPATPEGKRDWYESIRAAYGPRKAAMREELDVIPRDGQGTAIPTVWLERAMPEVRPVLRLVFDDDFPGARRPSARRGARSGWRSTWRRCWMPPWKASPGAGRSAWTSRDIGTFPSSSRRASPPSWRATCRSWSNWPTRPPGSRSRSCGSCWTGWNAGPSAGDASGPGQTLMEYTGDRYGRAELNEDTGAYYGGPVHEVVLSRAWYGQWMSKYIGLFEDGFIALPRDASLEDDHRAVEYIDGIPMVPKIERKDLKDADLVRHGDGAIAGALMNFAATNPADREIDFMSTGVKRNSYAVEADVGRITDTGWGTVSGSLDMGGF